MTTQWLARITFVLMITLAPAIVLAQADDSITLTTQPTTLSLDAEEGFEPATQPANVTPEARALLERIRDAYRNLQSLEMTGTVVGRFDIAGEQGRENGTFTGTFAAPNKFRHDMQQDMLLGSTGL